MNSNTYRKTKIALWIAEITAAFFCAVFLLITSLSVVSAGGSAYADDTVNPEVMQDLSTLKINGKNFAASDFPVDTEGTPQLLYLSEVGYSYYKNVRDKYALFVYVYNPAQLELREDTRNCIQLIAGSARPEKYKLTLKSGSSDKLFYKFEVAFSESEKNVVLDALNKDERVYDVNSIELFSKGFNATDYAVQRKYVYKGYAAGFGADGAEEGDLTNTLEYTVAGGTATERIEVKHTAWRPEGTNGKDEYTQDSITSVYFAVPKELTEKYDYLSAVRCQWLEAVTAPMFVTDHDEVLSALNDLIMLQALISDGDKAPEEFDLSSFEYLLAYGNTKFSHEGANIELTSRYLFGDADTEEITRYMVTALNQVKTLFWALKSENGDTVSSSSLLSTLRNLAEHGVFRNDERVANKYPSYLFEGWATEFHKETINIDKKLELNSEKVEQTFWEWLFGGSHVEDKQKFKGMKAIQEVTESDVYVGSEDEVCNRLYIGKQDLAEFKSFYDANKADNTVYLLRFDVSDYKRYPVDIFKKEIGFLNVKEISKIDEETHSYIAQETFYLDFDIIYFDYKKNDEHYIIPVTMSPVDITPGLTPPPFSEPDFMPYGFGIIGGLAFIGIVYGVGKKAARR